MGEPIVLQQAPDFASQLASGVANFFGERRKAQLATAATNYAHNRDKVADTHWNQDFGIKQGEFGLEKNRDARDATTAGDQHTAALDEHALAPIKKQSMQAQAALDSINAEIAKETKNSRVLQARAEAQRAQGEVVDQGVQIGLHRSQAKLAQLQAAHEPIAQHLADLQQQASTAASYASANASNASASYTGEEARRSAALLPGEIAGQNITNMNNQYGSNPLGALSPYAQSVVNDLTSHASKLTPVQMQLRIATNPRMSPAEKNFANQFLSANKPSDYNPAATGYVKPPRTNPNAITAGERDAKTITSTLEKNAQFSGLPANAQANFLGAFAHGHTYGDAVSAYKHAVADPNFAQSFGVSGPEAQSVLDALGVSAQ